MITVETKVKAPIEKVWDRWIDPNHITKWCSASDDWHAPFVENDVRVNGKFKTTMAAKDGSMSFDFEGMYTNVQPGKLIEYSIADGRKVKITFSTEEGLVHITEAFDPENVNPHEMQKSGWQAILDNFKRYVEQD